MERRTDIAPEVLNQKYKSAADVYSFGVMLYECFKCGGAFPKDRFKFPWAEHCFCPCWEAV